MKTVTIRCEWTTTQTIEVPDDWEGTSLDILEQFGDEITPQNAELYDLEILNQWGV